MLKSNTVNMHWYWNQTKKSLHCMRPATSWSTWFPQGAKICERIGIVLYTCWRSHFLFIAFLPNYDSQELGGSNISECHFFYPWYFTIDHRIIMTKADFYGSSKVLIQSYNSFDEQEEDGERPYHLLLLKTLKGKISYRYHTSITRQHCKSFSFNYSQKTLYNCFWLGRWCTSFRDVLW